MSNKNKYDGLKVEKVYTSDVIKDLVRENSELKAFVNAPFTKGRKTTRRDYIKTVWDLSGQITKAKEIIKAICVGYKSTLVSENEMFERIQKAEQFISEVEK